MFEDKIFEQFLGRPRADRSGEIIPKILSTDSGTHFSTILFNTGSTEMGR